MFTSPPSGSTPSLINPGSSIYNDLKRSGLSDAMIVAMGVEAMDEIELSREIGEFGLQPGEEGYRIPYLSRQGVVQADAPFNIRLTRFGVQRGEKLVKYCRPSGAANAIYFPPGFEAALVGHDYVIVTEGEKKAAKAVQEGFPCVAIQGVYNWMDPVWREHERIEGLRVTFQTKPMRALMDLHDLDGKKIYILFDSDAESNLQVKSALRVLSDAFQYYAKGGNAWVAPLFVPQEIAAAVNGKAGLDDWLSLPDGISTLTDFIESKSSSPARMSDLIRFSYAREKVGKEDASGKTSQREFTLNYFIPNSPRQAKHDIHKVYKQVLEHAEDGTPFVATKEIGSTRVWMNRIINNVDDDSTVYEMAYIPLSGNDIRYSFGGPEMISLGGSRAGEVYANRGANIIGKERPAMEEFFNACQTYGVRAGQTAIAEGTRKRGWMTYRDVPSYVMGGRVLTEKENFSAQSKKVPIVPIESNDSILRDAIRPHGEYNLWRDAIIDKVLPNPIPLLYVSGALTGLLRHWCPDSENFILHLYSESSSGKTTAMYAAAGLWGDPKKLKDAWRTTDNGLEGRCVARNDMALFLDETGQAKEDTLKNSIYLIGNGSEKMRATRDGSERRTRDFEMIALSTGEHALLRGDRHAGQEVRVMDIPTHADGHFWDRTISNGDEAERFSNILLSNYGFAADKAIHYILRKERETPDYWKKTHLYFTNLLRTSMDKKTPPHIVRRAKHPASLLTATLLLLEGVLELDTDTIKEVMGFTLATVIKHLLTMSSDQFSGGERVGMLEHLLSSVATHHGQHFHSDLGAPRSEVWGVVHGDGGIMTEASVIPSRWVDLCKPYDGVRLVQILDSIGALTSKSRDRKTSVRIGSHVLKCYRVNLARVREWVENRDVATPDELTPVPGVAEGGAE